MLALEKSMYFGQKRGSVSLLVKADKYILTHVYPCNKQSVSNAEISWSTCRLYTHILVPRVYTPLSYVSTSTRLISNTIILNYSTAYWILLTNVNNSCRRILLIIKLHRYNAKCNYSLWLFITLSTMH